jgi:hypothetical protein
VLFFLYLEVGKLYLHICVITVEKLLQACVKVCVYVRKQVEKIKNSMDGKNVDTVLMELGVRFHRLIYEHLQQYSYSCMGGMLAICDVAEYRKCAKDFKVHINKLVTLASKLRNRSCTIKSLYWKCVISLAALRDSFNIVYQLHLNMNIFPVGTSF